MHDILHQFQVNASQAKVFDAFTSPSGLNSWWTLESSGKADFSEIYRFYFGPQFDWRAKVIHVVSEKELTWQITQAMDDWMTTQVGFRLSETENGCTVYFFHANWQNQGEHYAITSFCWGRLLQGLKDYVEHGTVVPFDNRN